MRNDIEKLLPHRGKMLLIDEIISKERDNFVTTYKIKENSLLFSDRGVPSYALIEYMAQSIAAYNSFFYSKGKDESKIGFIVRVRKFQCAVSYFSLGSCLKIKVSSKLVVDKMGSFVCTAFLGDEKIGSAKITAYVPTREELKQLREIKG